MRAGLETVRWRRCWPLGGGLVGVAALSWVFWRTDFGRLGEVVAASNVAYLSLVPLAIALEQLVRAWKWRQILHPIRAVGTLRLFGAIMAGYFANLLVPLGVSPLVRAWLLARLEDLRTAAVLATVALDRLIDGVVFTGFVALVLALLALPASAEGIRLGLIIGGFGGLAVFAAAFFLLARYNQIAGKDTSVVMRLVARLPRRATDPTRRFLRAFADGIVWPRTAARGVAIVFASVVIKLIAASHFLWAGLAFGVLLAPMDYVFLLVFLGFLIILSRFARIPGGFFLGALFALDLLGVGEEQALAMTLVVQSGTILTVAAVGAVALGTNGVVLGDLRSAPERGDGRS